MLKNNYIQTDKNIKSKIYEEFNVSSLQIKNDIKIIQDWVRQEPHLPQNIQDDLIEMWLVRSKFQIEKVKEKIDKYYTLKSLYAEEIKKAGPVQFEKIPDHFMILPLPFLTEKFERVVLIKFSGIPENEELLKSLYKYILCMNEFSMRCDFCVSYRIIQDCEGFNREGFMKVEKALSGMNRAYRGVYSIRIGGIEYLNVSTLGEFILKTLQVSPFKFFQSEKILSRITVHKDLESLYKNVDRACLPPEYGGELTTSVSELHDKWLSEIKNNIKALEEILVQEISDESKRVGEVKYNEFFGASGTFKNLTID